MGDGNDEFDVTHTFATHLFLGDFNTTTVADDSFVTDAFVFSTVTLIVLDGTENAFAEKTVAFGFICTVVDGLGFENLAAGFFEDFLGRCQSDGDLRESGFRFIIFFESHICDW